MRMINFYANGSSGNHGCEAITRSLIKILSSKNDCEYSFASFNVVEDIEYIKEFGKYFKSIKSDINKKSFKYLIYRTKQFISYSDRNYYKLLYANFLKDVRNDSIYCSIGGDNYSYGFNEWLFYLNEQLNIKGATTYLVGCSILDNINNQQTLINDFSLYKKIICREGITYKALKDTKIKSNLYLIPDPAFQLNRVDLPLPEGFIEGNTVGINVSPMIIGYEKNQGMTLQNYITLIQYLIDETDMQIALIPHVVWSHNDDRIPLKILYDRFKETGRICMIEDHNAEELKGYIARCRFMIVARTHASIAAYSQQVPTLVVGYSVKARGIATDIFGTDKNYVIPVQSLQNESDLKNAFLYIATNEKKIQNIMSSVIPEYNEKVYQLNNIFI